MLANHLKNSTKIKSGSFYTPNKIVKKLKNILYKNKISGNFVDTSCGYGAFLESDSFGFDLDKKAIKSAKKISKNAFHLNSLKDIDKINKKIPKKNNIIVGNPPYNNFSSLYKKNNKGKFIGLNKYKTRDIGISFMRSYVDINANHVAILHPLAFLIKKTNFIQLKSFKDNFKIIDSFVFSSHEFSELSNKTPFPIVIALYKRNTKGMDWDYIREYKFNIEDKYFMKISKFDFIETKVTKYKDRNISGSYKHFHTLRDINALSRNATWLKEESKSSIRVQKHHEAIYKKLELVKSYYTKNKNSMYFIGNLSPFYLNDKINSVEDVRSYIMDRIESSF